MFVLGLTGQSGAGKGAVCDSLQKYDGVKCLDTDLCARTVVERGSECLDLLCEFFGKEILLPNGELDRKRLAEIAFSDEQKHQKLNEITHFYILQQIKLWLEKEKKDGTRLAVIDAPLLFESGCDKLCDMTVGVLCNYDVRLKRIMERDGIDEKSARARLDCQPADDFFERKCDCIVTNDGTQSELEEKVCLLMDKAQGFLTHERKRTVI